MGRLRGRRAGDSEDSQTSDTPTRLSENGSRLPSASRNFKDAAKAVFRRSTSRGSSSRNKSDASEVSPAVSPTKDVTSQIPDISGPLMSNPTSPDGSGPGYPDDWPLSDSSSPEILPRPRPIVDPHTMRASDHSSVSSYETTRSHQRSSTLTPNTSRPQSEMGIVSTAGAGDGQKVLGGNEKPTLASLAALSAGLATRRTSTPPVRKKSSRRRLRTSAGSETSTSSNAPATPTMSHAATTPTSAANRNKATFEGEVKTQKVQSPTKPVTDATEGLAPLPSRNHASPVDPAMLPKPLNLNQSPHANHSSDSVAPHKLRRQAKSRHLLNGEITANSPQSTESPLPSPAGTPVEKRTPPVSRAEVASNGGVSSPRMRSPQDQERKHRGRSMEEEAKPLERILVRCCSCGYFHDLPHRLYEQMIMGFEGSLEAKEETSRGGDKRVSCPWCRHVMDVRCCAGYVAVLQLKERLH